MRGLLGLSAAFFIWTIATVAWDAFNLITIPTMIQVLQNGASE